MVENISLLSRILPEQRQKGENGHRLDTLTNSSHCELSFIPRHYIRPPNDEEFRGVLSNLDASMPTSMLMEVGGGIFSTNFLALKHGQERQPTPKNGAEGQYTSASYKHYVLIMKDDIYLPSLW